MSASDFLQVPAACNHCCRGFNHDRRHDSMDPLGCPYLNDEAGIHFGFHGLDNLWQCNRCGANCDNAIWFIRHVHPMDFLYELPDCPQDRGSLFALAERLAEVPVYGGRPSLFPIPGALSQQEMISRFCGHRSGLVTYYQELKENQKDKTILNYLIQVYGERGTLPHQSACGAASGPAESQSAATAAAAVSV